MQKTGCIKVDDHRLKEDADEVVVNTISLKVTTTENPNNESLTQKIHPKIKPNPTPKDRKKTQKIHPTRESTRVLRMEKIGSSFKIILLVTKSVKNVIPKRMNPKNILLIRGKIAEAHMLTPTIQSTTIARIAFLYDGRVNMEE